MMQRFHTGMLIVAWPAMLLLGQAAQAQNPAQAPLCCTAGQTRMDCLEQRESYWNKGIVCRDPAQLPSSPSRTATATTGLVVESQSGALLPPCCNPGQNRMECLEQREKYWTQGIACHDSPTSPRTTATATIPIATTTSPPPATTPRVTPATPATVPQSAPPRISADAAPSALQGKSAAAAPPAPGSGQGAITATPPLPAKTSLPACCSKDQSRMDCLEQRERLLTMGIACQGGK